MSMRLWSRAGMIQMSESNTTTMDERIEQMKEQRVDLAELTAALRESRREREERLNELFAELENDESELESHEL